ncbi:hypothetical protein Clacol_009734 [Clathrus columnatus]|uniref:DUF6533 domain-containing protein n=1 Tax=Clathrus columnatus TaxID=1419009 RepID=A0AAV5ASY9_9AGAM|nr:hypothetical protein Clacol_009734 [Clathrus columnatus]
MGETYRITEAQAVVACLALLAYASFLHLRDEVEYIWRRKFTLPTLLYVLAKYPVFPYLSIVVVENILPEASQSVFNALGFLSQSLEVLPFIGVQGLISIRAYALCQGYRPVTIGLAVTFLIALGAQIYAAFTASLLNNISIIISDVLAFAVVIRQVWGLWKLKQSSGLKDNKDLITALFHQGILRFSLSTLLICEFTLAVRRRNGARSTDYDQSTLSTPAFQENPVHSVRFVLGHLHESILTEMGERNGVYTTESGETDDVDLSSYEMSSSTGLSEHFTRAS